MSKYIMALKIWKLPKQLAFCSEIYIFDVHDFSVGAQFFKCVGVSED